MNEEVTVAFIVEEIDFRMGRLEQYERDFEKARSYDAVQRTRSRRDELYRLYRIIKGI